MNLPTSSGALLSAFVLSLSLISCGGSGGGSGTSTGAQLTENQTKMIADLVNQQTVFYNNFKTKTSNLQLSASNYCSNPDDASFAVIQNQWKSTMLSWKKAEWISLGPVESNDRFLRIQSWPRIASSRVPQKVNELISSASAPISQIVMGSRPVSVQGLPALEYLLFQAGITGTNITAQQCAVLEAITVNLNRISSEVVSEWPSFASDLKNPSANGEFVDLTESINFLANQLLRILIVTKDNKVGDPLGFAKATGEAGTPSPEDAEAWRSKQSLPALLVNIQTVQGLFRGTSFGIDDLMESLDQNTIKQDIDNQISSLITTIENLIDDGLTISDNAADPRIQALYQQTRALEVAVQNDLFPSIAASVGFNFNDGD